jgi:hypothetical protein
MKKPNATTATSKNKILVIKIIILTTVPTAFFMAPKKFTAESLEL